MKTWHQANVLSLLVNGNDEGDDFSVQPFTIKMDLVTTTHQLSSTTLINLGADCNVMSYDIIENSWANQI